MVVLLLLSIITFWCALLSRLSAALLLARDAFPATPLLSCRMAPGGSIPLLFQQKYWHSPRAIQASAPKNAQGWTPACRCNFVSRYRLFRRSARWRLLFVWLLW